MTQRTMGTRITRVAVAAVVIAVLAITAVTLAVVWFDAEADGLTPAGESPLDEMIEHLAVGLAVATPIGVLVAAIGARWAVRRATRRIDALIATATTLELRDLGRRLPGSDADDELEVLAQALNALFARIERAAAAQRQFAADAAHELRTPLAVLTNSLEVARRRPRTVADWEGTADATLADLRRMTLLATALLELASLAAPRADPQPIAVDAALDRLVARWRERAADAHVTLVLLAAEGVNARVDGELIELAVGNLIANALRAAPAGSEVHVELVATASSLTIAVDDAGPGVPEPERVRIFAPFARGREPRDDDGVGLGLAIVARCCEAMAATVCATASARGGARFEVRLPPAPPTPSADGATGRAPLRATRQPRRR